MSWELKALGFFELYIEEYLSRIKNMHSNFLFSAILIIVENGNTIVYVSIINICYGFINCI